MGSGTSGRLLCQPPRPASSDLRPPSTLLFFSEKVAASSRNALDTVSRGASLAGDTIKKQIKAFDDKTGVITKTGEAFVSLRTTSRELAENPKVVSTMDR